MTIRAEPATATPCWVLRHPDGSDYEHFEGIVHYPDEDTAAMTAFEEIGDRVSAVQLDTVCLVAVCQGCGREIDGDYGVHYTSRTEAEQAAAEGCLWCS